MVRLDLTVLDADLAELTVGGVARLRDSLGSLYDRRATTEAPVAFSDQLDLSPGYVLRNQLVPELGGDSDHRLVASRRYPIRRRTVTVTWATLYERYLGRSEALGFNRHRQQIDLERSNAPVSPWIRQSLAIRRKGFFRTHSRESVLGRSEILRRDPSASLAVNLFVLVPT